MDTLTAEEDALLDYPTRTTYGALALSAKDRTRRIYLQHARNALQAGNRAAAAVHLRHARI